MLFSISLAEEKIRRIFLVSFSLSFLLPLFIFIYVAFSYITPLLSLEQIKGMSNVVSFGVIAVIIISLSGYFLMSQLIGSFEKLSRDFRAKSRIGHKSGERVKEESEIQHLISSFDLIYKTASENLDECRHLREQLSSFISVASNLTSELDFERLFPLIISKVTEAMEAERTSLYVIDWDKNEIWTKVAEGVKQLRLPIGTGISGKVAESGEVINVKDAWELPYFDREFDHKHHFRTKSVLCMPVKNIIGERIGVLQVINKKKKDCFDEEDARFMQGLASQVGIALENSILIEELLFSFNSSISTLSAMVDARHPLTAGHSERVTEYCLMIAKEMVLSEKEMEVLKFAALLHDIGKIGIRDDVLLKDGQFTLEERAEMNTHPVKTKAILDNFRFPKALREVPDIAWHHHEKINGNGYPDGLTGDQIPLGSKIIAVADVFDALTSPRDYPKYFVEETLSRNAMPLSMAISILKNDSGSHFAPEVVDVFMRCLPKMLMLYRGTHFPPEYVDETISFLAPEMLA